MSPITADEIRVLQEALDDEYKAWATYAQVIEDFGDVRPFSRIVHAERRHIDALLTLFERYRVSVPANPWPGKVERYQSLKEACEAGVQGELENAAMYDRLLAATTRPDIKAVLQRLQAASQERHLAAFVRCASR